MKMIFKICLKRLRYSVYALFVLTLCYRFAERWDSGALYSLFLFILLPLFVLALVWAVYTSIRDTARYKRSGVLPNDPPTLAERIVWLCAHGFRAHRLGNACLHRRHCADLQCGGLSPLSLPPKSAKTLQILLTRAVFAVHLRLKRRAEPAPTSAEVGNPCRFCSRGRFYAIFYTLKKAD